MPLACQELVTRVSVCHLSSEEERMGMSRVEGLADGQLQKGRMGRFRATCVRATISAVMATVLMGAAPALADNGKVLVFTGSAGTPNPSTADAASAISTLSSGA